MIDPNVNVNLSNLDGFETNALLSAAPTDVSFYIEKNKDGYEVMIQNLSLKSAGEMLTGFLDVMDEHRARPA